MSGKELLGRAMGGGYCGWAYCDCANDCSSGLIKSVLSDEECAYYSGFQYLTRQKSYFYGRWAAKMAVRELYPAVGFRDMNIGVGVFDFPVLEAPIVPSLSVSISHTEQCALALAFPAAHPMGVDIELVDKVQIQAVQSQCGGNDLALLREHGLFDKVGHGYLWSMKEAVSKALRTGLMLDYTLLSLSSLDVLGNGLVEARFANFPQYKAIAGRLKDCVYALALPERTVFDHRSLQAKLLGRR